MAWFKDILTVVGFLLTALGTYLTYKSGETAEVITQPLVTICLVLTFLTTIGWYHFFFKSAILKSVLQGRDHIDGAMNLIYELNHDPKRKVHVQQGIQALSEICQQISAGLRKYHSPDISVCIHYVNCDDKGPYVNVLCRNTESKQRQAGRPPAAFDKDYIDENSDFKSIIPLLRARYIKDIYYINNFLPFSAYYRNSHFSKERSEAYYRTFGWISRIATWELPYKSTLVVPLISFDQKGGRQVEGFLSIDSPKLWSFSKSYDLPIVIHFAGIIAPLVAKYNQSNLLDK